MDKAISPAELANKQVVETILTKYIGTKHHVRLFYGDVETGRDWADEFGMNGYCGRSIGMEPCLLLIANSRCLGGSAILTRCVLRIIVERLEVYRHPLYQEIKWKCNDNESPDYKALPFEVLRDGEVHARFET
jgi:hypothetical protein